MKHKETLKQTFFTFTAIVLGLAAIEVMSSLALPVMDAAPAALPASSTSPEPQGKENRIFSDLDNGALAPTVLWNIVGNALTYPHEELMFHVMPGAGGRLGGYTGVNSLGYRGREFHLGEKKDGERRILILGDSCGFGWGIEKFEDTFHHKLGKALETENENYVIYNLSQPGYSSYQAMTLFNEWADTIKPDFVVIYLGWNDSRRAAILSDRQAMAVLAASNNRAVKWMKKTSTYKVLRSLIMKTRAAAESAAADGSDFGAGEKRRSPINETLENLDAIIKKSQRFGAEPIVILPPFRPWGDYQIYDIHDYNEAIYERFKGRAAFPALNSMRLSNPENHGMFLRDGYHPAAQGSEVISNALYNFITGLDASEEPDLRKTRVFNAVQLHKRVGVNVDDPSAAAWLKASRHASAGETTPGTLVFGPYVDLPAGSYKATFSMRARNASEGDVAVIKVTINNGRKTLASRTLSGADFAPDGEWDEFDISFDARDVPLDRVETTVEYKGGADLYIDHIKLEMLSA